MGDYAPMRVWTNRVPSDLIDRVRARAEAEHCNPSALLRATLEHALASPLPIMPPRLNGNNGPDPADCAHPEARRFGYLDVCADCHAPLPAS